MQLDGATLYAYTKELNNKFVNSRIERISQLGRFDLCFVLRQHREHFRLVISTNPELPRLYYVEEAQSAKDNPSPFIMLLRKHLGKGRIESIRMDTLDRIIEFQIDSINELMEHVHYRLMVELMGKHSNLILVDDNGSILDSIRRVPSSLSSVRTVLPEQPYVAPPSQEKLNPFAVSVEDCILAFEENFGLPADRLLLHVFSGLSPFFARQICKSCGIIEDMRPDKSSYNALAQKTLDFFRQVHDGPYSPCVILDALEECLYGFAPILPIDMPYRQTDSLNDALALYFIRTTQQRALTSSRTALLTSLETKLAKLYKRLSIQTDALAAANDMETLKNTGELILSNLYQIQKGQDCVTVHDYLKDCEVTLRLDPVLSPADNAQKYFKKYAKQKTVLVTAKKQIDEIQQDIAYLTSVEQMVKQADSLETLSEIRAELSSQNILHQPQKKGVKQPQQQFRPLRFCSTDGVELLAGRNNTQNDILTLRYAKSTDTWLHAQGMPGSHVIIRHPLPIPPDTLNQAAQIAAYFSKGKHSANVPIDYTQVKYVKKPSGAKPGFVNYTSQKTLFITPDEKFVKSLIRED